MPCASRSALLTLASSNFAKSQLQLILYRRGRIDVDSTASYQEIVGFGAAFTDSATINFYKLPKEAQDFVIDAYFGPDGIGYTIGRIPMGSCDFSVEQYNYDDVPGDYSMEHFDNNIEYDQKQRVPMIKEALKRQPNLKLFMSPWSPPAWMKYPTKDKDGVYRQSMIESSYPQGLLDDPRVKHAWALYFSKFISAYKALGVDMWGVTIQNEPENPGPWEACVYNASSTGAFLRDHLGPVLREDHPELQIMAYDHNKDHMVAWTQILMHDPATAKYLDGMAFHWYYGGMDRGLDGSYGWGNVEEAGALLLPHGKFMLSSESCHCPFVDHTLDGSWARAEHLAHDVLADLEAGAGGWVDWNIFLDYDGGPNHAGNLCDVPIYANEDHSGAVVGPMYHFMGHVSRFVPPGSRRIASHARGAYGAGTLGSRASGVLRGFEASLAPCDGSVRQRWALLPDGRVQLVDQLTEYFQYWKPVCLGSAPDVWTRVVTIVACDEPTAGVFSRADSGALRLDADAVNAALADAALLPLENSSAEQCLALLEPGARSGRGAGVTLGGCGRGAQRFDVGSADAKGGAPFTAADARGQCLTAGWPWFTASAFETPRGDTVVVVLNEAEEPVEFDIVFQPQGRALAAAIPAHSIQTYVL
ncbi:Glucosylceramidase, family GH30 [Tribonema minus]|uniref:Glucosylceramidase, family GH30 n=1 Tax=Tribonema minus TaxID=303371 RepID=A0A835Z8L7_9STRA|nr:Glucosylceramidase, family GH30 [Tribonema minus]